MAGPAGNLAAHRHDVLGPLAPGVGGHITHALARDAQALGKGVAGQRIIVEFGRVGRGGAAERDLAVRLVGQQEDVVAVLGGRLGQKVRQLPQGRLAVRGAAGVVGAVDEHGGGVFVHQPGKGIKVDLEIRAPGRCDPQRQARALDIGLVLGKEGGKGHDVLPGHSHAAHGVGQRTRRAGGHKDMVGGVVHAKAAVQALGHGLPGRGQRQRRRVAMQLDRVGVFQQVFAGLGELRRAGDGRIPQRIVKDILVADFLAPRGAPLRNLADNRLGPQHIFIVLCNHNNSSFVKCLSRCGRGNGSHYWALSRRRKRPRWPEDWPPYM